MTLNGLSLFPGGRNNVEAVSKLHLGKLIIIGMIFTTKSRYIDGSRAIIV